jgi:hypothetical protein
MPRLIRIALMAACLSLTAASASSAMASAPTTVFVGQTAIDSAACMAMKQQLVAAVRTPAGRAKADAVTVRRIQHFDVANGSDCYIRSYETRPGSGSAQANYVQGYWKSMGLWLGGWNAGAIHVDVGMVITGSIATTAGGWGPNCYFTWYTGLYIGGTTWCGVWNNGNWFTEPGTNYWVNIYPYVAPPVYHYMRYCVEGQGVSCSPWGS